MIPNLVLLFSITDSNSGVKRHQTSAIQTEYMYITDRKAWRDCFHKRKNAVIKKVYGYQATGCLRKFKKNCKVPYYSICSVLSWVECLFVAKLTAMSCHSSEFTGGGNWSTLRKENHRTSVRNAQTATLQVFEGKHELQMLKLTILHVYMK